MTARFVAALALTFVVVASAVVRADSPPRPPEKYTIWSKNRRFCAELDPDKSTTTVFRLADDGSTVKTWAMLGWHRVAALADDGDHLVIGHWGQNLLPMDHRKDEVMLNFIRRGELIAQVGLDEIVKDPKNLKPTVSHVSWGNFLGFDDAGRYVVETCEGKKLAFDPKTGKAVP